MCITSPGRVVALDAEGATIEVAGRRRRAATLVLPDVAVGDWVLIGAGSILRRLEPADALDLDRTVQDAIATTDARDAATRPTPGGTR